VESKVSLLTLLQVCGDTKSLEALQAAAAGADPQIRDAAVRALADWPNPAAWDILAGVIHQPENESLRGVALHGLVRMAGDANAHPDEKLISRYRQLLAVARDDADRKLILGALGGTAAPDALQLALSLLANPGLRAEVEVAVKKIAASIQAQHPQAARDALEQLKAAQ
jgi:hypothetical protein